MSPIETYVKPMRDHRAKLDGDTGSGAKAAESLRRANTALTEIDGRHDGLVRTTLGGWYGQQAGVFQDRVGQLKTAFTTLSANSTTASTVAGSATEAVTAGRTAIDNLITEFIGRATPMLEAAETAAANGDNGGAIRAYTNVRTLADDYATKTGEALTRVRDQLTPLIGQLTGLPPVNLGELGGMGGQIGPAGVEYTSPSFAGGSGGGTGGPPPGGGALPAHHGVDTGAGNGAGPAGGAGGGGSGHGGGGHGGGGGTAVGPHLPTAIPPQPGDGVGVNLPDGSSAEAPNEVAAQAVRNAMTALGTPYVWGASNPPSGTDCSGLTSWAYGNAGLQLPRHSAAQAIGASVPDASQLLPGDLTVWDGHVAMIVGNGQMIEAGDPVQVNPVRTSNIGMAWLGFYRPTG
jgi:cell wall-associated NlpC family hydrolase